MKEKPDQIKSIQKIKLTILLPKNVRFLYNLIIEIAKNWITQIRYAPLEFRSRRQAIALD